MRSLKSLLMVVAALILVSCSMSAKPEKNETEKVSSGHMENLSRKSMQQAAEIFSSMTVYGVDW